jgi:hypothetical protein
VKRRDERPERPPELCAFRLADWIRGPERPADGSDDTARDEYLAGTIATAWGRYADARREFAQQHGDSELTEWAERRRARPAEWQRAEQDAGAVSMTTATSEETP